MTIPQAVKPTENKIKKAPHQESSSMEPQRALPCGKGFEGFLTDDEGIIVSLPEINSYCFCGNKKRSLLSSHPDCLTDIILTKLNSMTILTPDLLIRIEINLGKTLQEVPSSHFGHDYHCFFSWSEISAFRAVCPLRKIPIFLKQRFFPALSVYRLLLKQIFWPE